MIRRSPHQTDYVIIRNEAIRDENLSFKARGVLALLLSMPDNWRVDATWIATQSTDGRTAVLSALNELEDANYLRRSKMRDPETNQWVNESTVFESSTAPNVPVRPQSGFPTTGNLNSVQNGTANPVGPESGFRESGNLTSKEVPIEQIPIEKDQTLSRAHVVSSFDEWWRLWPKKRAKVAARKAYKNALNLPDVTDDVLLAGVESARREYERIVMRDGNDHFFPWAQKWLNEGRWDDEVLADRQDDVDEFRQSEARRRIGYDGGPLFDDDLPELEGAK